MVAQQADLASVAALLTSILERSRADARIQKLQAALHILVSTGIGPDCQFRVRDILLSPFDEAMVRVPLELGLVSYMLDKYMYIIRAAIAGNGAHYEYETRGVACSAPPSVVAHVLTRLTGLQARFEEDLTTSTSRTNSRASRWLVYLD